MVLKKTFAAGLTIALLASGPACAAWFAGDRDYAVADASALALIDVPSAVVRSALPRQWPLRQLEPQNQPPGSVDQEFLLAGNGRRIVHRDQDGQVRVWDMPTSQLSWQLAQSYPVALLGKDEDRLALLTSRGQRDTEFSVRDLRTNQPVFQQSFHLPARYRPLPAASTRFAAFTFAQRELWVWDDEQGKLRQLSLPPRYFIMPPLVFNRDQTLLAVSGTTRTRQQSGGEILVFNTRTWKLVQTYANDDQVPPQALGWSGDGRILLAVHRDQEFVQFDVCGGHVFSDSRIS